MSESQPEPAREPEGESGAGAATSAAGGRGAFLRLALPLLALGLGLRLALLWVSGEPELQKDESGYLYLALAWERFGVLLDAERYLWPPAWPFVLRLCLDAFGRGGLFVAKLVECAASLGIGLGVMSLGARLAGVRAARVAGLVWALYLPLAAFTHLLWSEPLFLGLLVPAVALLVRAQQCPRVGGATGSLLAAGLAFGLALLVKEVPSYLAPLLAGGVALSWLRRAPLEGLRRASLFLLAVAAPVAPWTLRNLDVYGRVVPVGISLGENVYHGLNARYVNFDLAPLARDPRVRAPLESLARPAFVRVDPAGLWERAEEPPNTAERSAANVERGRAWLAAHPGDFARTRVKKLADLVAPTSFFVRHQALGAYRGPLERELPRRLLVAWALAASSLLLLFGVPGMMHLAGRARRVPGAWIPLVCGAYFAGTSLLVSMSRFRLALVPWLIVAVAALCAAPARERLAGAPARLASALGLAALGFLWWVDWPELSRVVELAWTR